MMTEVTTEDPNVTEVPNPKWHNLKQSDGYQPNLINNTKISVVTDIGNYYNFYKYEGASITPNLWMYQKNGVWQKEIVPGLTEEDYKTIEITVLDDLISWMYSLLDPVTGRNIEKPIKIVIN